MHRDVFTRIADGKTLTEAEAFNERGVLRDGIRCSFSVFLRDSAGVPAGPFLVTDAAGSTFQVNEDLIRQLEAEAEKAGLTFDAYLRNVLRFQFAASQLAHTSATDGLGPRQSLTDHERHFAETASGRAAIAVAQRDHLMRERHKGNFAQPWSDAMAWRAVRDAVASEAHAALGRAQAASLVTDSCGAAAAATAAHLRRRRFATAYQG